MQYALDPLLEKIYDYAPDMVRRSVFKIFVLDLYSSVQFHLKRD